MKGLQSAGKWCTLEVAVGALGIGRGTVSWQERVSNRATPGEPRGPLFLRTAELARRFASMFLSLEICEIENSKERANFRHVQCRGRSRGLRQAYTPVICLTTSSESENTWRDIAPRLKANCKASRSAMYSATFDVNSLCKPLSK